MYIRKGSSEKELIKQIQVVVGVEPDGNFGSGTESAVRRWQMANNLVADGVVGPKTLQLMQLLDTDSTSHYFKTDSGLTIQRYYLPRGEYLNGPIKPKYAFIHHTAGWDNPFRVIDDWGRDSRGAVGTEFVVGGQKITDGSSKYDGTVLQAFPEGCQGWHLGNTGSRFMNENSVGIEICAFGYLKDGRTYTGVKPHESQISELAEPFRGFALWHKYSDAQLKSVEQLLEHIADRDNIDIRNGLPNWIRKQGPQKAFEFQADAHNGQVRGLLTHTNVRKDKFDNFPQAELIDMLLSL